MLRRTTSLHPSAPPQNKNGTGAQKSPQWTTSSSADTETSSSIFSEEVLLDLDESAMSQLPQHLQNNMREIHHERVKRRKEQEHNRTHQNHHSQWFNDVMSRLRTSKPTIIPYGGLRALSSAEQLEVAPWPEPEPTPHAGAVSGEVSPKDRKGLMMEGSLEESVWVAGKRERAAPVGRIYGPHLRRPARGEGCPSRSKRYNETIGGNAGGYPGSEGVVRGQLRRRGSLVFGDLGWRVKNRMQRVSRFLREL